MAKINDALKFKSSVSLETQVMECSTQARSNEENEISKRHFNLIIHNLDESQMVKQGKSMIWIVQPHR